MIVGLANGIAGRAGGYAPTFCYSIEIPIHKF